MLTHSTVLCVNSVKNVHWLQTKWKKTKTSARKNFNDIRKKTAVLTSNEGLWRSNHFYPSHLINSESSSSNFAYEQTKRQSTRRMLTLPISQPQLLHSHPDCRTPSTDMIVHPSLCCRWSMVSFITKRQSFVTVTMPTFGARISTTAAHCCCQMQNFHPQFGAFSWYCLCALQFGGGDKWRGGAAMAWVS